MRRPYMHYPMRASPLQQHQQSKQNAQNDWPHDPKPHSVGGIIASFRSAVPNRINQHRQTPGAKIWYRKIGTML